MFELRLSSTLKIHFLALALDLLLEDSSNISPRYFCQEFPENLCDEIKKIIFFTTQLVQRPDSLAPRKHGE